MAETNGRLRYCKECGEYTEYDYMGKLKKRKVEENFTVAAAKKALGMDFVPEKLFDDRPRLYKCKKCGGISQG